MCCTLTILVLCCGRRWVYGGVGNTVVAEVCPVFELMVS